MPYISQSARRGLKWAGVNIEQAGLTEGELNYLITSLVHRWLKGRGVSYVSLNAAIGILECAKQELYRRVAAPYEDKKIKENGDIGILEGGEAR